MSLTPLHQYLMIGKLVALLGAIAVICWQSSQIHRWHTHYNSAHDRIVQLERESKAQQSQVGKTVDHYITVEKPVVRKQVEKIESAPLPGNCKTPQAVLEADL